MFWERFYDLCVNAGTKPNAIREKIGVSSGVLTKWKKGECLPNGESLKCIADYLDCSVDYLLGRTDNPKSHISTTEIEEEIAQADQVIKTAKYHLKSNLAEMQVRRELERKMMLAKYLEGVKIADGSDLFDGIEIVASVKKKGEYE